MPSPLQPLLVEGMQGIPNGSGMTTELCSDLVAPQPLPATGEHLGVGNPVSRLMDAAGQVRGEMLGPALPPSPAAAHILGRF